MALRDDWGLASCSARQIPRLFALVSSQSNFKTDSKHGDISAGYQSLWATERKGSSSSRRRRRRKEGESQP